MAPAVILLRHETNFMNAPNELQFVDTNILVYAHDRSAGLKHIHARQLIQTLWDSGNGCTSIQVLQEFYVTVTRKVTHPLAPEVAAQHIADLATWKIHRPHVADLLYAIQIQSRFQLSFWDAMIIASANQLECATVWSEDLSDGQVYDRVRVRNPLR